MSVVSFGINERTAVCWITLFHDVYGGGLCDAHILDACLCVNPEENYDFNNKIRMNHQVHSLFDNRLIYLDDGGYVKSPFLDADALLACGIKQGARVLPQFWNKKRRAYNKRRCNNYYEWKQQQHLAKMDEMVNKESKNQKIDSK